MHKMNPVSPNIWVSEDFQALSDNGKFVWIHLLTGSHNRGVPGLFRGTRESLRAESRRAPRRHNAGFKEILARGMMEHDEAMGVIWLPKAIRWNLPASYAQVFGWLTDLVTIPPCQIVYRSRVAIVTGLFEYKNRRFAEHAWDVWHQAFGPRLPPLKLDDVLPSGDDFASDSDVLPRGTGPASDPPASLSRASNNVRARAGGRVAPASSLSLDLIPDPDLESGVSGAAGARAREGMSQDVADVIQVWLDDVCAAMEVKPKVAQAHVDRVQELLDAGVSKETLVLALRGAAEDRYVQGTKPGSPKGGKRDLLWLFRTLDGIQTFATDGAALSAPKVRTWLIPADLAAKAEETGPIAPANREGFQKLLAILANPPPLLPGVPNKVAIDDPATGVAAMVQNDVTGRAPSKGDGVLTPGQTPPPSEELIQQWVGELERLQEEDREAMLEVFLDTYKIDFPRERLSGTTAPRGASAKER